MAKVERSRGHEPHAPAYVTFRPRRPSGLRAIFGPALPAEILLVETGGVAIAVYDDDRARSYPSFRALLRAHRLRGDELEVAGFG